MMRHAIKFNSIFRTYWYININILFTNPFSCHFLFLLMKFLNKCCTFATMQNKFFVNNKNIPEAITITDKIYRTSQFQESYDWLF